MHLKARREAAEREIPGLSLAFIYSWSSLVSVFQSVSFVNYTDSPVEIFQFLNMSDDQFKSGD